MTQEKCSSRAAAAAHARLLGQGNGFTLELGAVSSSLGHEHSFGIVCLFLEVSALTGYNPLPKTELMLMLGLATGYRLLRYSLLYLAVLALGGHISWALGFMVQLLSLAGGRLMLLPGGAGGAEAVAAALLTPVLGAGLAVSAILLWRFFTFYLYLVLGALALVRIAGGDTLGLVRGYAGGSLNRNVSDGADADRRTGGDVRKG